MTRENKILIARLAAGAGLVLAVGIVIGLLISGGDSDTGSSSSGDQNQGYLGVTVSFQGRGQLRVASVEPGGPAEEAGIEPGDILRSVDGIVLRTPEQLRDAIESSEPDDLVTITYERGDEELRAQVRLDEAPEDYQIEVDAQGGRPTGSPSTDLPQDVLGILRERLQELIERSELSPGEIQRAIQGQSNGLQVGAVAEVSPSSLTILTFAGEELTFDITDETSIIRQGEDISPADLHEGETIMVLSLDQGESAFGVYAFGTLPVIPSP